MRNIMGWLVVACFCLTMTGCYNAAESRQNVLKIYNWADYIGEGVLEDFQQYYKEQYFGKFLPILKIKHSSRFFSTQYTQRVH